ncbi:Hpt domain-containing protein [Hahella sp. CR1]|uniref:Hpt domain-containing protein n=1 Tax=unclassified Hahella TaxID=2624107 RepID=UPI002441F37F|nr:Hpt domain-containing protein [Hahella sp. CR1]MDG9668331.1 Hpt domain-containing protein [Hahella sp. CR1]
MSSNDLSHLDMGALAELREVMEDDFQILVETFIGDTIERMRAIRATLDCNDPDAFSRGCHSIKGSATNLGLPALSELCRQGELIGKFKQMEKAREVFDSIEQEFEVVQSLLREQV